MNVDYVKLYVSSGNGGKGSVHLHREKYITKGGPDGVDGGRGGHVIIKGSKNLWTLYTDSNQLESIDVTHNPKLAYFACSNNNRRRASATICRLYSSSSRILRASSISTRNSFSYRSLLCWF